MGFAVAQAAIEAGAEVTLIAGPVALATPTGVKRIDVETAQTMFEKVMAAVNEQDIFISCAAVADYRPAEAMDKKIKKTQQETLKIELEPTIDIVTEVAQQETKPFIVGFAAETQDISVYAQEKLQRKGLDMIAANQVGKDMGFAVDQNALDVFWKNETQHLALAPKSQVARDLMTLIIEQYYAKDSIKTA